MSEEELQSTVPNIPEIGQAWERGEQRIELADISARRVWLFVRRHADDVGEYDWHSREKWPDVVRTTMAVTGTRYIPGNAGSETAEAKGGREESAKIEEISRKLAFAERERDEARKEIARLQMELDSSCSAEELRQARQERDEWKEIARRFIVSCAPDCGCINFKGLKEALDANDAAPENVRRAGE